LLRLSGGAAVPLRNRWHRRRVLRFV
jgi:hypothetical protein